MSLSHYIRTSLNIKDENITFSDEFVTDESIKGVTCKVYHATLSYTPTHCECCGTLFDSKITKHGFKPSRITLPKMAHFNTYLNLRKQRYFCSHCHSTFTCQTSLVEKNCHISSSTKHAIFIDAQRKKSECDIAYDHNVSHCTVSRTINTFYEEKQLNLHYLPESLCFDEFKSVKHTKGAMSFIYCDATSGEILDILEDRTYNTLYHYFMRFPRRTRKKVKRVVIDMYSPYMKLIKAVFPKAKIIFDKFHVVQLMNRALNRTRIAVMNQHKNTPYYTRLKKYWRLLQMNQSELNPHHHFHCRSFKKYVSTQEIVDYLLSNSAELKATYEFVQAARHSIKVSKIGSLVCLLQSPSAQLSSFMLTAINSMKKHLQFIKNMMRSTLTNGVIEGINNKIKVIKRIAFGYRSFYHFKARILIIHSQSILNKKHKKKHSVSA